VPALLATPWRLAILDEAQAIKTPGTKQTRAAKQIDAQARIALSGTPVENRLGDLWSIFDFLNPGLLGSGKAFSTFTKRLSSQPHNAHAPLRALVRPYILRRLKIDKSVIADLPAKTEIKAFCHLTRKQAALYQQSVADLAAELGRADGMKRRGIVLASLMRLKQICNHPSQWLGDGSWSEADSGKLARLREISEVIAAKQEKVLVFTQFREATTPVAAFLGRVFGRPGLVLHGETAVGLASDDLSEMFGIEMAPATPPKRAAVSTVATKPSTVASSKASSRQTKVSRPAKLSEPTSKRRDGKQRPAASKPRSGEGGLTPAKRRAISKRMRMYWAARRNLVKKQKASQSS